jgi:regulator of sigma E protease
MLIFLSIIAFIVMLSVIVFSHEFGHFIVAKKSGMKVDEFGFGFPPRILGIKKGDTIYSINWIPLGGFVKIAGEDNTDHDDPRSFANKSFWQRFLVLIAGIIMNFILAAVIFTICSVIGIPATYNPGDVVPNHATLKTQGITITDVEPNTPAETSGIDAGDIILSVNGKTFTDASDAVAYLQTQSGQTVQFTLKHQGQTITKSAYDRPNPPANEGAVGIAVSDVGILKFKWYAAPWAGIQQTWEMITGTIVGLYGLIRSGIGFSSLGGPVKIAQLTGQATALGIVYVLQFTAYISVNIGILNAIPFPALDGGRVLFLVIEKIRGKRNNANVEGWVNTIGFFALLALILVISAHDVFTLIYK